ncbi:MAG: SOS response-associated peptidase [Alphaproteobacteria bacterium]
MCGRYHITRPLEAVAEVFDAIIPEEIREAASTMLPRFNIAPTQMVPIIRLEVEGPNRGRRIVDFAHWGLVPSWAKDTSMAPRMINARSETVAEKPSFRAAFRHRRCLIPTSGFYEWKTETRAAKPYKQPFRIHFADERLMVMGGLFEVWQAADGSALGSCSMLTTAASETMRELHPRMPVILDSEDEWDAWLSPHTEPDLLLSLCQSHQSDDFSFHAVDRAVGQVRNESADLLRPVNLETAPTLQSPDLKPSQGNLF